MKTANQLQNEVAVLLAGRKFTGNSPAVRRRQRTEETIVLATALALLDAGYTLGVNDSEDTTIHHSTDISAIQAALFTTDQDWLLVYVKGDNAKDKRPQYWVRCIYGNDGYDVLSDYSQHLDSVVGTESEIGKLQNLAEEGHI